MSRRIISLLSLTVAALILMSGDRLFAEDTEIYTNSTVCRTTFTPDQGDQLDPCYVGTGKSRLCALDCEAGEAVFNFDTSNDAGEDAVLRKSDRHPRIGTAIPSGMVIALIRGASSSYIGVGGGIDISDLSTPKAILRIYWRYVF